MSGSPILDIPCSFVLHCFKLSKLNFVLHLVLKPCFCFLNQRFRGLSKAYIIIVYIVFIDPPVIQLNQ